jgi:putative nucleotidyltransferase with HDIG domain
METATTRPVRVDDARDIARVLLNHLPGRWRHTVEVARRAEELAGTVDPEDREHLVAAAWLHDIGYADEIVETGFHPVDGARFLDRHGWPRRLSSLVAHHSGAVYVAGARGLVDALRPYRREDSPVSDALAYADQTIGPNGERVSVEQRMADALYRHGPDSPSARAHRLRAPYLRGVASRVERRLASA